MVHSDAPGSPFHELNLQEVWEKGGRVRVRQHVNPLRAEFQAPVPPLVWDEIFDDPTKPLFVDIGTGYGRFLLLLASRSNDDTNYFGIEIRRSLVERANSWAEKLGCSRHVYFHFANATNSFESMLSTYPGPLQYVAVQFPDPHFKKRYKKRRVFQRRLVEAVKTRLAPGGHVFLQSDVLSEAEGMRDAFEAYGSDVLRLAEVHHSEGGVFFCEGTGAGGSRDSAGLVAEAEVGVSNDSSNSSSSSSSSGGGSSGTSSLSSSSMQLEEQHNAESSVDGSREGAERADAAAVAISSSSGDGTSSSSSSSNSNSNSSAIRDGSIGDIDKSHQRDEMQSYEASTASAVDESNRQHVGSAAHSQHTDNFASSSDSDQQFDVSTSGSSTSSSSTAVDVAAELSPFDTVFSGRLQPDEDVDDEFTSMWQKGGWLKVNPLGCPTEREYLVTTEGGSIYRVLLQKGM